MVDYIIPNWTTLGIVTLISIIPIGIAFVITLRQYLKERYRHNLYMMLSWLFMSLWILGLALSELYLSIPLRLLSNYSMIPTGLCLILLLDSVSREYVEPMKFSAYHILSAIVIFASLEQDALHVGQRTTGGGFSVMSGGFFKTMGSVLLLVIGISVLYLTVKISISAPNSLKKYARINVIGGILIGIVTPLGYMINLTTLLPGSMNIVLSTGTVFMAYAFAKEPKLAYILPFKAIRVTVIHTKSGLALYTHSWSKKDEIDESLFSGMLHGISSILNEALNKGNVKEIQLDDARLILHRSEKHDVACVLIATKSTLSLRNALENFSNQFFRQFSEEFENIAEVSKFDTAGKLIEECFPFVPQYD